MKNLRFWLGELEAFCCWIIITIRRQLVKWPSSCVAYSFNTGWPFLEHQPACVSLELLDDCCVEDRPARSCAEQRTMEMALCYLSGSFFFLFRFLIPFCCLCCTVTVGFGTRVKVEKKAERISTVLFCCCLDLHLSSSFTFSHTD